ncbi:hypothetical protein [Ensifer sp. SSB1]|jgi:cytochrome c-type biogenesis protein CcmH/NrfG|uniref:hypothetical protein n=1 Tax=Ensifer sp. SSB1 TaxID=2795385 RepID=UPI001A377021|nr:hypothetical protein [Ensifer sp. SSB1]MBK5568162.1 hypothetical protein [Ensifer sp. SSB1]
MTEHLDERGEPESATHGAERTKFSAREVRQAGMGARVFLVLAASLVLALVAWGAVEWGQGGNDDQTGSVERTQPTSAEQQPEAEQHPSTDSPQGLAPIDRHPAPQSGTSVPSQNTAPDDANK